ncbi:MAG: hypothetical protein R3247_14460 [Rhodothermales bacterium]|nr:hypothetical protein [Rhodothermales bacterium]
MKRVLVLLLFVLAVLPAAAQERHAVLIGGLGGSPAHTEVFRGYLFEARRAFVEALGVPAEHVTVLAEAALEDEAFVDGVSTAENIRAAFERLAARVAADGHVYVVLFGHGSFDGTHAQLNIPRRDLADADYAELLGGLRAERVVFVNTASASAPFAEVLSGPGRVVITATRSGTQRNETVFPQHFVAALADPAADLDYSGDLSVLEVFRYAAERTARGFEQAGTIPTENALLEDTGDARAARLEELGGAAEGSLAAVTYLRRGAALAAGAADPALAPLLRERDGLERQIAEVKSQKAGLDEDIYYARLEQLFLRLARLNERIEGTGD